MREPCVRAESAVFSGCGEVKGCVMAVECTTEQSACIQCGGACLQLQSESDVGFGRDPAVAGSTSRMAQNV
eukprot:6012310-Amphidinium_carterae.3